MIKKKLYNALLNVNDDEYIGIELYFNFQYKLSNIPCSAVVQELVSFSAQPNF